MKGEGCVCVCVTNYVPFGGDFVISIKNLKIIYLVVTFFQWQASLF